MFLSIASACWEAPAGYLRVSSYGTPRTFGAQRDVEDNPCSMRDFAVDQVVLTNDLQIGSVGEQLIRRDAKRRFFEPHDGGVDT